MPVCKASIQYMRSGASTVTEWIAGSSPAMTTFLPGLAFRNASPWRSCNALALSLHCLGASGNQPKFGQESMLERLPQISLGVLTPMRSPFARGVRRLVRSAQSMVSQIVVSVAAAICVAFITTAYLEGSAKPEPATVATIPKAEAAAPSADGTLPALDVEVIADVPEGVAPGQEIFPGAPVGLRPEALQQAAAKQEPSEPRRRRFLGIPIPFTSTANEVAEEQVSGG
jgi:hypothetical protein